MRLPHHAYPINSFQQLMDAFITGFGPLSSTAMLATGDAKCS